MGERVSVLLTQSLAHLAGEVPAGYRMILDRLGTLVVALDIDGEQFSLRGGPSLDVRDGAADDAGARIATSRTAILDVLDARLGLEEAVETGAVHVLGALDDILQAHDTLLAYVHAAVRGRSQPGLLSELRMGVP